MLQLLILHSANHWYACNVNMPKTIIHHGWRYGSHVQHCYNNRVSRMQYKIQHVALFNDVISHNSNGSYYWSYSNNLIYAIIYNDHLGSICPSQSPYNRQVHLYVRAIYPVRPKITLTFSVISWLHWFIIRFLAWPGHQQTRYWPYMTNSCLMQGKISTTYPKSVLINDMHVS